MADLTGIEASQSVKIAGANPSTGVEDNYLEIDSAGRPTVKIADSSGNSITNGQQTMVNSVPVTIASNQTALPVSQSGTWATIAISGILASGVYGNVSLPTANTPVEVKVGGSRLTNRKLITVMPLDNNMYWGYSNSVTSSNGTPIFKNQAYSFEVQNDSVQIWLVCSSPNSNMRVTEAT